MANSTGSTLCLERNTYMYADSIVAEVGLVKDIEPKNLGHEKLTKPELYPRLSHGVVPCGIRQRKTSGPRVTGITLLLLY
jgi:hypothetical protein